MPVSVTPVSGKKEMGEFIRFPWKIYAGDRNWVPPLIMEREISFDKAKNPVFSHLDAQFFLARRGDDIVGRISAQVDHEHNHIHKEKTGFFGAFEAVDDPEVAGALLRAAEEWVAGRGMERARGPFTLNINEEAGMLVEGFESPPSILTNYAKPYYAALVEGQGYAKVKDLYGWRYTVGEMPPTARKLGERTAKQKGVKVRTVDMSNFKKELRLLLDLFNSAWSQNWGFIPLNDAEVDKAAEDLKLVIEPQMALFAEVDGVPAAVAFSLRNIHESIADLDGKLFPFGILKLLWRMKVAKPKTGRLVALGIKKEFRGMAVGGSLAVLLYYQMHLAAQRCGVTGGEIGWTLEDNVDVNRSIEFMGGKKYKTYRIWEKVLGGAGAGAGGGGGAGAK